MTSRAAVTTSPPAAPAPMPTARAATSVTATVTTLTRDTRACHIRGDGRSHVMSAGAGTSGSTPASYRTFPAAPFPTALFPTAPGGAPSLAPASGQTHDGGMSEPDVQVSYDGDFATIV